MRRTSLFLVIVALALFAGCRQAATRGDGVLTTGGRATLPSEEKLAGLGLEIQWDRPLLEEQIKRFWIMPDAPSDKPELGEPRQGFLVAYTRKGNIYAIDFNGHVRWMFGLGDKMEFAPTVFYHPREKGLRGPDDEFIFVSKSTLHVLDTKGNELWKLRLPFTPTTSPVANATHIFIGASDDKVYRISKEKKFTDWHWLTNGHISAAPVLSPRSLYFGSEDGYLYGFSLDQKGVELRGKFFTGGPIRQRPVFYLSTLYAASDDYHLYAIESIQAPASWRYPTGSPIIHSPVPIKNTLYVSAVEDRGSRTRSDASINNFLFALNRINKLDPETNEVIPAGSVRWKYPDGDKVLARGRENLYFQDLDGNVLAVDDETGSLSWKDDFGRSIDFFVTNERDPKDRKPYVAENGGTIFMAFRNGVVVALREKKPY